MKLQQQVSLFLFAISLVFIAIGCDSSSSNNNFSGASSAQIIPSSQETPAANNDLRPIANSIFPNNGSSLGGTQVTITGSNFDAAATVCFGETAAANVQITDSAITCDSPPGAPEATINIKVINPNGQMAILGSAFTYFLVVPSITQIAPTQGTPNGGTAVTITGNDFLPQAQVFFGENLASNIVIAPTQITCETPAGTPSSTVEVTVENINGATDTLPSAFNYIPLSIATILPTQGSPNGGTFVTLTGTGFEANPQVSFGGASATNIVLLDSNTITCETPPGAAGATDVTVENQNGDTFTLPSAFNYVPLTLISVTPAQGSPTGGTPVTLTGTGFETNPQVLFGLNPATNIVLVNTNTITCNSPSGAAGSVDVTVENQNGDTFTLPNSFSYGPLTVTGVSPSIGIPDETTPVTISGTGFEANPIVEFGGISATNIVLVNLTTITCDAPSGVAKSSVDVMVQNQNGDNVTMSNGFSYPFNITSISVENGTLAGGTSTTIFGEGFGIASQVFFDGTNLATNVVVIDQNTITCDSPAGTSGAFVEVAVENSNLERATLAGSFLYALIVTNDLDSGPGSLRQTILDAASGETILFDSSLTGATITLTTGELLVNKNLNILGLGAASLAIDGNAASRIFNISSGMTFTLSDLTITNGFSVNGGGIFNEGTAIFTSCTISNNSASDDGGGIYVDTNGTATITDCMILNNSAPFGIGGGLLVSQLGTATVTNCTISTNYSREGGGIENFGTAIITYCNISNNSAPNSGGGGFSSATTGTASLTNCTISNNTTSFVGGGVSNLGTTSLTNCTISNNSTDRNTTGGNNVGAGGIFNSGTLAILNCTITGNSAPFKAGGGYYNFGSATGDTVSNSIIAGNTAALRPDVSSTIISNGYNLIGDETGSTGFTGPGDQVGTTASPIDPLLGPLQDNGGPTETHALLPGSPAIDAGEPASILIEDQRGFSRPSGVAIDIGAYEF